MNSISRWRPWRKSCCCTIYQNTYLNTETPGRVIYKMTDSKTDEKGKCAYSQAKWCVCVFTVSVCAHLCARGSQALSRCPSYRLGNMADKKGWGPPPPPTHPPPTRPPSPLCVIQMRWFEALHCNMFTSVQTHFINLTFGIGFDVNVGQMKSSFLCLCVFYEN